MIYYIPENRKKVLPSFQKYIILESVIVMSSWSVKYKWQKSVPAHRRNISGRWW